MLKVWVGGGGVVMVVTHLILRSKDKEEIYHDKWIILHNKDFENELDS